MSRDLEVKVKSTRRRTGSSGISPRILSLGTRCRWVVIFAPRPFAPGERASGAHLVGFVGLWACLDMVVCPCLESNKGYRQILLLCSYTYYCMWGLYRKLRMFLKLQWGAHWTSYIGVLGSVSENEHISCSISVYTRNYKHWPHAGQSPSFRFFLPHDRTEYVLLLENSANIDARLHYHQRIYNPRKIGELWMETALLLPFL
jgi:hypothetical protein